MFRLNFDPDPSGTGGSQEFSADNLPKNKTEWDSLMAKDPVKFAELTQANFNKLFRQHKELEEKLAEKDQQYGNLEAERNSLSLELDRHRTPPDPKDKKKHYSKMNLPATKEEWDILLIEDPVLGTDLRSYYNNTLVKQEEHFESTFTSSRKKVQGEHPDMYMPALDEKGQPIKDDKGNVVNRVDKETGELIFNPESEKGKLWLDLFKENPDVARTPRGPEMLMALMERRLREKGNQMINSANQGNQTRNDFAVITDGLQPPKTGEIKFRSQEEKEWAERQVARGIYKDLREYSVLRDEKESGYEEVGRVPTFGGKK